MGTEIERKFLVKDLNSVSGREGQLFVQGYIARSASVRIRLEGERGYLTIKGPADGARRAEFQYEIPRLDAAEMLASLCGNKIQKVRYRVPVDNHIFEVDVFSGENQGLVLAEVELTSEDEQVRLPEWLGQEVTGDDRFSNSSLAEVPYLKFGKPAT